MEQDKYKKLLEDLTAELKKINGKLPEIVCEINHLKEAIEAAANSAKPDYIGKNKIEKRS